MTASKRNPIYQAMLRTKVLRDITRSLSDASDFLSVTSEHGAEMKALSSLHRRGVITDAEYHDIAQRAARAIHARAILHVRAKKTLSERRRFVRHVVEWDRQGVRF